MRKKQKSSKLAGFEKVFSFTVLQTVKSKSFIASTLIMCAIFFFSIPLTNLMGTGGSAPIDGIDKTKIKNVYIATNEAYVSKAINTDGGEEFKEKSEGIYDDVKITVVGGNMETIEDKMEEKDSDYSLYVDVNLDLESGGYVIDVRKTKDSQLGEVDTSCFADRFVEYFDYLRREATGLTEEQLEFANLPVSVEGVKLDNLDELEEEDETSSIMQTSSLAFLLFIVCIMVFTMAGENVATSLITEKSTRVIEYVLVSIKPLSLVMGKILAAVATVGGQVLIFAGCGFASFKIFGGESGNTGDMIEMLSLEPVIENFSVVRIAIALGIFIAGIATYTTIASLIGSTATKIEQLQETIMIYSMICVVGAYVAMVLMVKNFNPEAALDMFILGFPLSAPFVTPMFVISGEISIVAGLIILAIQLAMLALLGLLVAKIFETLILYNGAKLKLKDIIRLARNSGKSVAKKGVADEK